MARLSLMRSERAGASLTVSLDRPPWRPVSDGDRELLETRVQSRTIDARNRQRARLVLMAADGEAPPESTPR